MPATDYARASRALIRRDPVLAPLIRQRGPCGLALPYPYDPFTALVRAIVGQQLSAKAGATIFRRVCELWPDERFPTPDALAAVGDERLRTVGLSRQKIGYMRDLSARRLDGRLPLDESLEAMSDEDVVRTLTAVKGIGRWSAEMFLIFRLKRPDVLPLGDVGLQRAVQKVYRLRKPPTATRLTRLAEAWRPYRSIACWYLWSALDNNALDA